MLVEKKWQPDSTIALPTSKPARDSSRVRAGRLRAGDAATPFTSQCHHAESIRRRPKLRGSSRSRVDGIFTDALLSDRPALERPPGDAPEPLDVLAQR